MSFGSNRGETYARGFLIAGFSIESWRFGGFGNAEAQRAQRNAEREFGEDSGWERSTLGKALALSVRRRPIENHAIENRESFAFLCVLCASAFPSRRIPG